MMVFQRYIAVSTRLRLPYKERRCHSNATVDFDCSKMVIARRRRHLTQKRGRPGGDDHPCDGMSLQPSS
jgi:hypothetical protein